MNKDRMALLEAYAENLSRSKSKQQYIKYAREFLEQAAGLDRASIDQYLDSLRDKGRKPGTLNYTFRVIRRLFNVNKLPWEYRQGEAPVIGQRDEYRPQLSYRVMEKMITAARDGNFYPEEACFLALSSTYGLRREEIANIKSEDINFGTNSVYIATLKFGRERYHLIPPEIKPYLEVHDFDVRYALSTLSQMFNRMLKKSGMKELMKKRLGFHSIRRPVFEGLINNGVSMLAARSFMRWKSASGDMAMPARYYGNVVIDIGGKGPVVDEAKGDEEIFKNHPFLSLWRQDERVE